MEAFKSTLDETAEADLLLHVVDSASPARAEQIGEVDGVLEDIGAGAVPRLVVFNNIDVSGREPMIERDPCGSIAAVSVSARSGQGLDLLRAAIVEFAQRARESAHPESTSAWTPAAVV